MTISTQIIWARFVDLTIRLFETRWMFVNVKSSLDENITISLRLNLNETSCETTLKKLAIWRLCFFICIIIVCHFECVDEIIKRIMRCCTKTSAKVKTRMTAKATARATTMITIERHKANFVMWVLVTTILMTLILMMLILMILTMLILTMLILMMLIRRI